MSEEPDEIDNRLNKLDTDCERPALLQKIRPVAIHEEKQKKESKMLDIQPFREAIDHGAILQVYKKNGKLIMEATPLFSKWLLYSVIINTFLLSVLMTKIVGLW